MLGGGSARLWKCGRHCCGRHSCRRTERVGRIAHAPATPLRRSLGYPEAAGNHKRDALVGLLLLRLQLVDRLDSIVVPQDDFLSWS